MELHWVWQRVDRLEISELYIESSETQPIEIRQKRLEYAIAA